MTDCIFCKIVNGELPKFRIYEDDKILAFLDIKPINEGHVLVIPKEHVSNLEETSEELLGQVINVVKRVGLKIKDKLAPGYVVIENNDPVAGQMVQHLHFHVVPRYAEDHLKTWPQHDYGKGRAELICEKLKIN